MNNLPGIGRPTQQIFNTAAGAGRAVTNAWNGTGGRVVNWGAQAVNNARVAAQRAAENAARAAAQEAARRKTAATNAYNSVKATVKNSNIWKSLPKPVKNVASFGEHTLGTPVRYWNAWNSRKQASQSIPGEWQKGREELDNLWNTDDKIIAQSKRDVLEGRKTPEQHNALVTQLQTELEQRAAAWTSRLDSLEDQSKAPIPMGKWTKKVTGAINWIAKNPVSSNVFKYTIGSGDENIPSLATAGRRALNTAQILWRGDSRNVVKEGAPKPKNLTEQEALAAWRAAGSPKDKNGVAQMPLPEGYSAAPKGLGAAWRSSYKARVVNPNEGFTKNRTITGFEDFMADPLWAGGLLRKGAVKGAGAVARPLGRGFTRASDAFASTRIGAKTTDAWRIAADSRLSGAVKDTAGWLTAQKQTKVQKLGAERDAAWEGYKSYQGAVDKQIAKQFSKLNENEKIAYQLLRENNGVVTPKIAGLKGIDLAKVQRFERGRAAKFEKFASREEAIDPELFPRGRKTGYLPRSRDFGQKPVGPIGAPKQPGFAREQTTTGLLDDSELIYAEARRTKQHLRYTGKEPYMDRIEELDRLIPIAKRHPLHIAQRAAGIPHRVWKQSVLRFAPTWYVNNVAHNIPASIMAGGAGTVKQYIKILKEAGEEVRLNPAIIKNLPEEVVDRGLFSEVGKLGKGPTLGAQVENISRGAAYLALRQQGLSEAAAIAKVNSHLFDYAKLANWERPFKAIIPFWQWQKNITLFTARLAFEHPKAAKLYHEIQARLVDQAYDDLPSEALEFTDSEGEKHSTDPRAFYKGKLKIPGTDTFVNTPFLPISEGQMDGTGISPWASFFAELTTGQDSFGRNLLGSDPIDSFIKLFPQWDVANKYKHRNDQNTSGWFTPSGYSKQKQGSDPSKPNYDKNLDPAIAFSNRVKSFLGVRTFKFDMDDYRKKQNFYAFMKEYTSHDWKAEYPDPKTGYDQREAAKAELAKRYGYDLEKDIYGGIFARNDTSESSARKALNKATKQFENSVYDQFQKLIDKPDYKGKGKEINAFIAQWQRLMRTTDLLDRMPRLNLFPNTPSKEGSGYGSSGKRGIFRHGKWFKSEASAARYARYVEGQSFWPKYFAANRVQRVALLKANPQFVKDKRRLRIADLYLNVDPDERKRIMEAEGLSFGRAPTAEEWPGIRARSAARKKAEADRLTAESPGFGKAKLEAATFSKSSVKPPAKRKPVAWTKRK